MLKKLKNKLLKKYITKTLAFNHVFVISMFYSALIIPTALFKVFNHQTTQEFVLYIIIFLVSTIFCFFKTDEYFSLKKYQKKEDFSNDFIFDFNKKEIVNFVSLDDEFISTVKRKIVKSEESFDDMQQIISAIKNELNEEEINDILINKAIQSNIKSEDFKLTNTLYLFKLLDAAIKKVEDRERLKEHKDDVRINALKNIINNVSSSKKSALKVK